MAVEPDLKIELGKQGVFVTTIRSSTTGAARSSCLADAVRPRLLRHRDDRHHHGALRPGPLRRRSLPPLAAPGRPDDHLRHHHQEDGSAGGAPLQPDAEPKYVIAMGACAISGGPFKQGYNVLKGIDRYIPVDVHIPGCPPRPEALIHAFMTLQAKIDAQPLTGETGRAIWMPKRKRVSVPEQGAHDLEPPVNPAGLAAAPPSSGDSAEKCDG
jgi:NADH-quinone oxidoreductase subunit B